MLSNRETTALYKHLSASPMDPQITKLIQDALDDLRSEPDLWSDFRRQAIRVLATNLRAMVEGMFEDFYFGPETARTAKMAQCAPMSVRFGGSIGRKSPNASTKTAASKSTRPHSITAIRDSGGNIWLPCLTPGRQSPVIGNGIERQRTVRNRAHQSCGERIDARPRHRNELRQGRSAILCAKVCRYQRVGELR